MPRLPTLAFALLAATAIHAQPAEDFAAWPALQNPFPSTGGGGWMIDGYAPIVQGTACTTDFDAIAPDGTRHPNTVIFDAIPAQGGILCANGRWRSRTGDAQGTTPFRVFIRDGVTRAAP